MTDPADLDAEAARLRERAAEIADDNPTAAAYHERRADWCEHLARQRREDERDG